MAIGSKDVSLRKIHSEFDGIGITYKISDFYRGGKYVENTSYNQNIPTSGAIDFSDFIGARGTSTSVQTVPAFSTNFFKISNDVRTYRVAHDFNINENSRFSFAVKFWIMGDEREPDTFTSTNTQFVRNPHIAIYVGGTASNGTTEPTGTKVLEATSTASSNNDDALVYVDFNVSNTLGGTYGPGPNRVWVVFSMVCGDRGGPDAPLSRWNSPQFDITIKTG
jgi:hypothetical protein